MIRDQNINILNKKVIFQNLHFEEIRKRRIFACLIDSFIVLCFCLFLLSLTLYLSTNGIQSLKSFFDLFCVGWIGYYAISLMSNQGSTIGMRLLKIKIVSNDGKKYHMMQAIALPFVTIIILLSISWILVSMQNGLEFGDLKLLVFLIPHFLIIKDQRKRTLQDIITRVIFIRSDLRYTPYT